MQRLSPGQRWVIGLGVFALVLLVVGLVAVGVGSANLHATCREDGFDTPCPGDPSGIIWGGVLAVIGLLHLGLTGFAGALVWTSTPAIAPRGPRPGRPEFQVFTTGELRDPSTQDAMFGRLFRTTEDVLPGWLVEDGVVRPGGPDDSVAGALLHLDAEWELAILDRKAGSDVRRVRVELASGATAWVFTPVV
ncbi:hypothetical protein [Curtobacterium luteum]|uniref:hypothetical protein n=1 Tax=Curtobacterium luteum TaxID=33881 RepID=UPI00381EF785